VAPITYTYQWQHCTTAGSGCAAIAAATGQNYVASAGNVGQTIRVAVTASDSGGTTQALSAATGAVVAAGAAPVSTVAPSVSGAPVAAGTLTVTNGTWTGSTPITFGYQWQTCTTPHLVCTSVAGATGQSYQVATSQVGSTLRAIVTATNSVGTKAADSSVTGVVLAGAPVNTALPLFSGSASVGRTLQISTGVWTGATTTGFRYQWSLCTAQTSACTDLAGATGSSFGIRLADLGNTLRVTVTATNTLGSTSAIATSPVIAAMIDQTASFDAVLRPDQEAYRPFGVSSGAAGHFVAKVDGKTLTWTLTFSHLGGRPTVATLNRGFRGTNGVAFKSLCRECSSPLHGTLTLTASQLDALLLGGTYVNVRTSRDPQGEIRGQINRLQ
jgi:hypothetical protein